MKPHATLSMVSQLFSLAKPIARRAWAVFLLVVAQLIVVTMAAAQVTVTDISPDGPYGSYFSYAAPSGRIVTLALDPVTAAF